MSDRQASHAGLPKRPLLGFRLRRTDGGWLVERWLADRYISAESESLRAALSVLSAARGHR